MTWSTAKVSCNTIAIHIGKKYCR